MNMDNGAFMENIASASAGVAGNIVRLTKPGDDFGSGLLFNEEVIHNDDDPMKEARAWVDKGVRERVGRHDVKPSLALVFGLGLGYHLKALRERFPDIELLVYEPAFELQIIYERHNVLGDVQELPMVSIDWYEYEAAVSREVVYGQQAGVLVVAPGSYCRLFPEQYEKFNTFVRQEIMRRAVIEHTRENTDASFLRNLAANAGTLMTLPDLMILKGRLPARPAFVVGSGPSLDESLPALREAAGKGMIFAAGSALKPLLAGGVRPDVVVVLESTDTSSYLELSEEEMSFLGPNCILALASGCHPAHYNVRGFNKGVFHLTGGESGVFSEGVFLPQGGNAGSAAFALAYVWGLGPLMLVAQDQAYGNGRMHASGTPGEVMEDEDGLIKVNGIGGTVAKTHTGLLASVGWFAEAAKTIAMNANPPMLFNASAGGAQVPGFTEVPLEKLVAALHPMNAPVNLAGALPKLPLPKRAEVKGDLAQMAGMVNTLRRLAKMDYKKAYAEIKEVGKISKFLAQILAEASVANGRKELASTLERADGLMTLMMSSLMEKH